MSNAEIVVEKLLPHAAPALLVIEVVHYTDDEICCIGRIPSDHPSVSGGFAPSTMALEFGAQSAGVLLGVRRLSLNPDSASPEFGYLVSLKDVVMDMGVVPAARPLRAKAKLKAEFGKLALFSVRIDLDDERVLGGHLGIAAP